MRAGGRMDSCRRPELVYVLEKFPSETASFVYNELRVLDEEGMSPRIFSLVPGDVCPDDARDVAARTVTLGPVSAARIANAFAFYLFRRPGALLRLLLTLPFDTESGRWGKGVRIVHQVLIGVVFARAVRGRPCHFHAHFAFKAATAALVAAELNGASFSFTSHGSDTVMPAKRFCLRQKIRIARFVVAISEYNRSVLVGLCPEVDPRRILVNRTGVLREQFPDRSAPCTRDGVFRILCVANLYPVKNHETLIRGCGILARRGVAIRLVLAGRDVAGIERRLRSLAESEGIRREVAFLGVVDHSQVSGLLDEADVCILTSHSEGIPVALMEAMARGVPVIGPRVTGVGELVKHEVTGLLIDPADPESVAEALARLVDDSDLGSRLARAGREHVYAQFDMRTNARALAQMYSHLIYGAPGPARIGT